MVAWFQATVLVVLVAVLSLLVALIVFFARSSTGRIPSKGENTVFLALTAILAIAVLVVVVMAVWLLIRHSRAPPKAGEEQKVEEKLRPGRVAERVALPRRETVTRATASPFSTSYSRSGTGRAVEGEVAALQAGMST